MAELEYPPFELRAQLAGKAKPGEANRWFDGKMLGSYLVSTGCFLHPISRRELLKEECEQLDAYLQAHNLGTGNCAHTFAHRADYTLSATPHNRVARMREEATGVLAGMFANAAASSGSSARERECQRLRQQQRGGGLSRAPAQRVPAMPLRGPGGRGRGGGAAGQGGLVVIDDDDMNQTAAIDDEIQTAWPSLPAAPPKPAPSWAATAGAVEPEPEEEEEEEAVQEQEEHHEEVVLAALGKYQIHFFGVVRRMAVESYLWSMQNQHELRWLDAPPDGLWTTDGEWAIAGFDDREAWREMGSRLGGGIRGLFSARIYVLDDEGQEQHPNGRAEAMRVFLRGGRTRKTKEALAVRNAADEKRRREAPAKAAAKAERAERAGIRRSERAVESAARTKVRRASEAVARAKKTAELAEQHSAMLERRQQQREAAEEAARAKETQKRRKTRETLTRRKNRDQKETALKIGKLVGMAVGGIVVAGFLSWLLEPRRRLGEIAAACSEGVSERGLKGLGQVGCAEPLQVHTQSTTGWFA